MMHYWGIRPQLPEVPDAAKRQKLQHANTRIEKAATPEAARRAAFGTDSGFQYKDFGTRVSDLRADKRRIALITEPAGWTDFPERPRRQPRS